VNLVCYPVDQTFAPLFIKIYLRNKQESEGEWKLHNIEERLFRLGNIHFQSKFIVEEMNPMTGEVLNQILLEKTICQKTRFKIASDKNWIVAGPFQPDGHFLLLYNVNKHETKFLSFPKDQVSISPIIVN